MRHKFVSICGWLIERPYLAGALVGLGLGSAFVWPILTPVALIALLLSMYLIEQVNRAALPVTLVLVFGVKALVVLSWFWSTYPMTWLFDFAPSTQYIAIFFYWTTAALWLSSAGLLLALGWRYSLKIPYSRYGIPILWVGAEYAGAVIFSILTAGPGSVITGAFSFGHIGYLFPYLVPVAVWGGVYLVGLVGLFLVVVVYDYMATRQLVRFALGLFVLVLIVVGSAHTLPAPAPLPTVAAINTHFPADTDEATRQPALMELVAAASNLQPAYIILPEDSRYLSTYKSEELGAQVAVEAWQILHASNTATLVDSGRTIDMATGLVVQRAFIWGTSSDIYTADKQSLVPQGEYMPSLYSFILRFVGLGTVANMLNDTINYTASRRVVSLDAPSSIPNILFCFESVSPLSAKWLVANRPSDFIVHPMSHSWFHEPKIVWHQLETMLRYQAVFARTPIISVGNEIRGQVYQLDGRVYTQTTVATFPYGTVDVVNEDSL